MPEPTVAPVRASLSGGAEGSLWDGLSPYLLGTFAQMRKSGDQWVEDSDGTAVVAAITEANMEVALNWQSPFESSGPESRAPMLMAMLQSGQIQPVVDGLDAFGKAIGINTGNLAADLKGAADKFEGRTGITKLNSTQVFNGMPPLKIQITALFRAWRDAKAEVETPFKTLMQMALPVKLAPDGGLLSRLGSYASGSIGVVDLLMPSKSPTPIKFTFKAREFSPLVIESVGVPLSSPIDRDGNFVELLVPMTLCSLTALDRDDWGEWSPA